MVKFDSLNLPEPVLRALADMGFTDASPIQAAAIPVLLEGRDVIGQAQTGTGKTAAFGVPLVVAALDGRPGLVLVPTRELAQQVCAEIDRIGKLADVRAIALYGGASFGEQARALSRGGADVIVATPGRLRDHIERGTLQASAAKLVVLDEADEMLKMGFVEEVEAILDSIGGDRQTLLFSATMPDAVRRLAERYLDNPEHVLAESDNDSVATSNTEKFVIGVHHPEKVDALVRLLAVERPSGTIVFRHTREGVDELVGALRRKGVASEALHGGMAQGQREDVLARLRDGRGVLLVATDVAARGLDVDRISHVINYDTPMKADAYVHRIGRTGRAGREGRSFMFVTPNERSRLRNIERTLGERLQWRDVPTDDEVHAAVAQNARDWLTKLALNVTTEQLVALDAALDEGTDPRRLAAALFARLAPQQGLAAPPLEARRARQAYNNASQGAPRHAAQHAPHARSRQYDGPARGPSDAAKVALVISVGRDDNVRPADLVGALTNEGGLTGVDVGRIDILPRMSVAEVPSDRLDELMDRMQRARIRNRDVTLRVAESWTFRAPPRGAGGSAGGRDAPRAAVARVRGA